MGEEAVSAQDSYSYRLTRARISTSDHLLSGAALDPEAPDCRKVGRTPEGPSRKDTSTRSRPSGEDEGARGAMGQKLLTAIVKYSFHV